VANQRISLKDRRAMTSDPMGVDALIPPVPTHPISPKEENTPLPGNGTPPVPERSTAPAGEAVIEERAASLAKVTLYVRPEQVLAIEEIQVSERRRTGRKRDKSELIQEAIDLLIAQYKGVS
jgi:hypothetical protein